METPLEALDWAISFIERFESPTAPIIVWHLPERQEDGSLSMPWCELSPDAAEFSRGMYGKGLIVQFDWPAWGETAKRYFDHPDRLVAASLEDCLKLLTVLVRADRFNEGLLGSMIERGQVATVLKRIRDIRDAGDQDGA